MAFNRVIFPDGSNIKGQQYDNVGEKPTDILHIYTLINRHAATPNKTMFLHTDAVSILNLLPLLYITLYGLL